ncbi:MAG TPA: hypothetical protein VHC70_12975 [Phycisphaerales bacterium]|jgi:hypothetical protein|nr:hypothetical protein [Phycisphaerales bacterium]
MDPFIVVVGLLLLVFGTAAALAWWYLVKRAAPYEDETSPAPGSRRASDGAEVIVLPPIDKPRDRSQT